MPLAISRDLLSINLILSTLVSSKYIGIILGVVSRASVIIVIISLFSKRYKKI